MKRILIMVGIAAVVAAGVVIALQRGSNDAATTSTTRPPGEIGAPPNRERTTSVTTSAPHDPSPAPAAKDQGPEERWRSRLAPKYLLSLKPVPGGVSVEWSPTIDSDIKIRGVLAATGRFPADPDLTQYAGTVHYTSGDASGKASLKVRFGDSKPALWLEFPTLWEDPIEFRRARGPDGKSCAEVAEDVVTRSAAFRALSAQGAHVKLMQEEAAEGQSPDVHDLRAFTESRDGEALTVARFRVDFAKRQLLRHDPAEDEYVAVETPPGGIDCR